MTRIMPHIAAIVVCDSSHIQFAGMDLAERAAWLVQRAGIGRVEIVPDHHPFAGAPNADLLLVVPERVVIEPGVLTELIRRGLHESEEALVVADADRRCTGLLLLSPRAVEVVRSLPRAHSALQRLAIETVVRVVRFEPSFAVQIGDVRDVPRVETEHLSRMSGAVSIPLSRRLLAWSITANEVTVAGFFLGGLAGLSYAVSGYWAGIAGALLH